MFAADAHVEVEDIWGIDQRMVTAYREPDHAHGRELTSDLIEVIALGRTLTKRATDALAYFDRPGTSPPKPSTAASNISADPPSASSASPTTLPDSYSKRGFRPKSHPQLRRASIGWTAW